MDLVGFLKIDPVLLQKEVARSVKPEIHSICTLKWFKQAGFSETRAQTFVSDISPPLSQECEYLGRFFRNALG